MHTQEQIEAYLAGTLSGDALQAFEARLRTDAALAEEVEIQRAMQQYLQTSPKDELRANLAEIGANFEVDEEPDAGFPWRRWLPILAVGIIGLSFFLYWNNTINNTPSTSSNNPASTSDSLDATPVVPIDTAITTTIDTTMEDNSKSVIPQDTTPDSPPSFVPPKDAKKQQKPIAAHFEPLPALEQLTKSQLRSGGIDAFTLPTANKNGSFTTDASLADISFRILLFNNKMTAYEDFKPVYSQALSATIDGDMYRYTFAAPTLEAGLYYWYLEDEESGEVYKVARWTLAE